MVHEKMNIEILEARDNDIPVLQNLARFYVYDMSEYMGWRCPEDGLFGCRDDDFWGDKRNHFFVVRVDRELAGFAVIEEIDEYESADYDVAEFFILRKFRRRGVGRHVAHTLFDRFRGNWQVRQLPDNLPAPIFWRKVISEYTLGNYEESLEFLAKYGFEMVTQRFNNKTDG
ncbi:GNAT family N-acetyltransferase [Candidatus Poribacteria bacterium]|nr:GNAT family N-acetyltransferase [Candidatus Poribacteria bacterium]